MSRAAEPVAIGVAEWRAERVTVGARAISLADRDPVARPRRRSVRRLVVHRVVDAHDPGDLLRGAVIDRESVEDEVELEQTG